MACAGEVAVVCFSIGRKLWLPVVDPDRIVFGQTVCTRSVKRCRCQYDVVLTEMCHAVLPFLTVMALKGSNHNVYGFGLCCVHSLWSLIRLHLI